jgi:hypothetical protein
MRETHGVRDGANERLDGFAAAPFRNKNSWNIHGLLPKQKITNPKVGKLYNLQFPYRQT